jgi:SAM-dependent methyltransferase
MPRWNLLHRGKGNAFSISAAAVAPPRFCSLSGLGATAQPRALIFPFRCSRPREPVFDLALSRFGIMFFADPVSAFRNIGTALVPAGRLAFVCWRSMAENIWAAAPMEAAMHLLPSQEPADPLAPGPFAFADNTRLHELLASANYSEIEIEPFNATMNMGATLEEAASEVLNIGPLARAAADFDEQTRANIRRTVAGAFAPYASPAGVAPPAACWLVRARL